MASTASSSLALNYMGLWKTVTNFAFKGAQKVYGWAKNEAGSLKGTIEAAEGIAKKFVSPVSNVADKTVHKALTYVDELIDRAITFVENKVPQPLKPVMKVAKKLPRVLNEMLVLGPAPTLKKLLVKAPGLLLPLLIKFLTWLVNQRNGPKILMWILRRLLQLAKLYNSTVLPFLKRLNIPYLTSLPAMPVKMMELLLNVIQQFSDRADILVQALTYVLKGDLVGLTTLTAKLGFDIIGKLPNIFGNLLGNNHTDVLKGGLANHKVE